VGGGQADGFQKTPTRGVGFGGGGKDSLFGFVQNNFMKIKWVWYRSQTKGGPIGGGVKKKTPLFNKKKKHKGQKTQWVWGKVL